MVRHLTATTYLFFQERVVFIWHNKLQTFLPPGGHLEKDEAPHEAAMREIGEETGINDVIFIGIKEQVQYDTRVRSLPEPFRILEEYIEANHYHIDLIYIAVTNQRPKSKNEILLLSEGEVEDRKDLFPNVSELAKEAFAILRSSKTDK